MTDWFEHASPGIALLFVAPLSGVYAAVRLVLPIGPGWVLQSIGLLSLFTAVYAAGMAAIQRETRRFFAHLFLSHPLCGRPHKGCNVAQLVMWCRRGRPPDPSHAARMEHHIIDRITARQGSR